MRNDNKQNLLVLTRMVNTVTWQLNREWHLTDLHLTSKALAHRLYQADLPLRLMIMGDILRG